MLIQEPVIFTDRSRRLSKYHPSFHQLAPIEDWSERPRVLIYILKHPHLRAELVPFGPTSRDVLAVQITTPGKLHSWSISTMLPAVQLLRDKAWTPYGTVNPIPPCLVAGDFNITPSMAAFCPTLPKSRTLSFLDRISESHPYTPSTFTNMTTKHD